MAFKGKILQPGAAAVEARLEVRDGLLVAKRVDRAGEACSIPIAALSVKLGGYDKDILAFTDSGGPADQPTIITQDHRILRLLSASTQAQATLVSERAAKRRLLGRGVLYPLVAISAFLALSTWFVLGPLVDVALWAIPPSVDRQLGDFAFNATLNGLGPEINDAAVTEPVVSLVGELTQALPPGPRFDFRTHVVKTDVVNAFALPGGIIVVTTGLLKKAPSEEAVAGVLAHEIVHVTERHLMRSLLKKVGLWAMLAALLGDISGLSAVAIWRGATLAELGFSRDMESEADEQGVHLLAAAGIEPSGLRDFFQMLEKDEASEQRSTWERFLSSHPVTKERIAAVEELIAEKPLTAAKKSSLDWAKYAADVP